MEGTQTSPTAVLVSPGDVGGRPQTATVSVAREEIEEALASDESPELILEVQLRETERRDLHVAWERSDLEAILAGTGPGRVTFSFEPSELYRALEQPDFQGHGLREAILLTVAAASASAAVAVSTAQGGIVEGTGVGGTATASMVAPGHSEAGTAAALASAAAVNDEAGPTARGIGVTIPGADESTLAARGIDTPAVSVGHDEAGTAATLAAAAGVNDEAGLTARGIGGTMPGADEATLAARGIQAPAAAVGHDEALTASTLANPAAVNDEVGLTARGIGGTIPGADESTLAARGIAAQPTPVGHDEATLVERGVESAPVTVDSGTGLELPSVDAGTAALVGGLAGAGLLIVGGTFATRRRIHPT
jgi:hypothetical protein